ncbi:MAG: hypothetical protein ABI885_13265 [Gammaproteobacteria bacterium]
MTSSTSSSEPRSAYSWRQFRLQLACVLAVFVVANVITYHSSEYFEKERRYHEVVSIGKTRPGIRVLFAGDSHFAQPLNGYLNENPNATAYSVAFGGDSARECFAKFREVLQSSSTLDTLVISADPHMFGTARLQSSNRSFADRYFLTARDRSGLQSGWVSALLDQLPLFNDDFVQYLRKAASTGLSRRHGASVTAGKGEGGQGDDSAAGESISGWQALSDADRSEKARGTGAMDQKGVGEHREPFYWYSRIMELARERHVRVIGARFPVHADYSAQVSAERVERIDSFLRREGVADIVDLRDGLTDPRDFEDPDHLNQQGAVKVLKLLEGHVHHPFFAENSVSAKP